MRVIEMQGEGGPEVLRLGERPSSPLLPGTVRVQVASSGVNRADLLQRRGRYPVPPGYPEDILGLEFAGTVVEASSSCRLRSVGDLVMGILGGGGYSEEIVVPEEETIRVPTGVSPLEAGAIPEVFITAWDALVRQAHISEEETVLIHSVGSGVGTAALQLCQAMGCRTIGTSRSQWKLDRAVDMGLEHRVLLQEDTQAGSWISEVEEVLSANAATEPTGRQIDVLLDLLGGAYFRGNLQLLGDRGRWVMVGLTSGSRAEFDLRSFIAKRATLFGTVLRTRARQEKIVLASEFQRDVVPLFESGDLRPMIDRTFSPEDAVEAHRYIEGNESFGKVLIRWDSFSPDIRHTR